MNFTTQAPDTGGSGEPGASQASMTTGSTVDPTTSSWENASYPATVGFGQAIEPQSLQVKVTTATGNEGSESPAGTLVAGTVQYNPSTYTASFRPDQPLRPGTEYHAVATADTVAGKAVTPIGWTFTAVAAQPLPPVPAGGTIPVDDSQPPPVVLVAETEWPLWLGPAPDEV